MKSLINSTSTCYCITAASALHFYNESDLLRYYDSKTISHSEEVATLFNNSFIELNGKKGKTITFCLPVAWKTLVVAFGSLLLFSDPVLVLIQVNICQGLCSCLRALWHSNVCVYMCVHEDTQPSLFRLYVHVSTQPCTVWTIFNSIFALKAAAVGRSLQVRGRWGRMVDSSPCRTLMETEEAC